MRQRTLYSLIGIAVLVFVALLIDLAGTAGGFKVFGRGTPVTQGLDLTGGLRVLLRAQHSNLATDDAMNAAVDVITKRVNAYGVSEPQVTRIGKDQIDVEVPGIKNPEQLKSTLGSTGQLVLYGMGNLPQLGQGQPWTYKVTQLCDAPNAPSPCIVMQGNELDAGQIQVSYDQFGAPQVNFGAKGGGAARLSSYTGAHIGSHMAIVLDGKVVTDPTIQGQLSGTGDVINSIGSVDAANSISIRLKYGALPIAFNIDASEQVSATLGPQYVRASIIAGIVGMSIVIIFMLLYYRLPGLLADVALIIYSLIVFAIFKTGLFITSPVTLTLAGIAGFILSIGMAVDANILIFERLKEELRSGKTMGAAVEAGFNRAWTSIRDSNISTMITCAVLYEFGQTFAASIIVGFALTLFIGVAVSMFTAVVVTRTFLRAIVRSNSSYNSALFGAGLEGLGQETRPVRRNQA